MKPRHKRLAAIAAGLALLAIAAALVLNAFQSNLVFFFSPSQVAAGEAPRDRAFRIGGLVQAGFVMVYVGMLARIYAQLSASSHASVPDVQRDG